MKDETRDISSLVLLVCSKFKTNKKHSGKKMITSLPEEREEERLGGAQADREWLVEYVVELPEDNPIRMITIIRGAEMSEVQGRLYDILRAQYASEARLDVTVVRMEPVDMRTDVGLFEIGGVYQP